MTLAPAGRAAAPVPAPAPAPKADIISLRATTEPGTRFPIRLPDAPTLASKGRHSTEVHP